MLAFVPSATVGKSSGPLFKLAAGIVLAAFFALGAAWLALRWWVWPNVDGLRPRIVAELSALAGRPVSIGRIQSGFDGLRPMIELEAVEIRDADGHRFAEFPHIRAVLALDTLWRATPAFALLELRAPVLEIERHADGGWRVAGVDVPADRGPPETAIELLMRQSRMQIHAGRIDFADRMHGLARRLDGIDILVGSVGRRHRGAVRVHHVEGIASSLAFITEFTRAPRSGAADWRRWRGQFYVAADHVDLRPLTDLIGPLPLSAGRGALRLWSGFSDARLDDLLLKLEAFGIEQAPSSNDSAWALPGLSRLSAELRMDRVSGGGYALQVPRFEAVIDSGATFAGADAQRVWIDREGSLRSGRLSLRRFHVADALSLAARLPLPDDVRSRVMATQADGDITRFDLSFHRGDKPSFEADVAFEGLSASASQEAPRSAQDPGRTVPASFENLTGSARIRDDGGELSIDAARAALTLPGVFEQPRVLFDRLATQLSWTVATQADQPALDVTIASMSFANPDAVGELSGKLRTASSGARAVDLRGRLRRADAAQVHRYLPLTVAPRVRAWVTRAVVEGRAEDVKLRLRGDLRDFPFRDPARGEFSVEARLAETTLAYAPDWPALERLGGVLRFDRAAMSVVARSGRIGGVALADARARIDDLQRALVVIEAGGQGPASDMLRFVNDSPLRTRIDDFTHDLRADGAARLQLRLELPLETLDQTRVAGSVTFQGNTIVLDRTIPAFSDVRGKLEFTDRGLALRDVESTFLGGPIKVQADTPEAGRFLLRAQGQVAAEAVRQVVDNPLTRRLSGRAAYRAQVDVRRRAATLTVESDLEGLASTLPAPFDKPAQARWPVRIVSRPMTPAGPDERPAGDTLEVVLREQTRLVLERRRDPVTQRLRVRRGGFGINAEPAMGDAGLQVAISAQDIDFGRWSAVMSEAGSATASPGAGPDYLEGFSLLPTGVTVVADSLRIGGKTLRDVVFGASRLGGFWRANVAAREVNGFFNWREPGPDHRAGALQARFVRLEIPPSRSTEIESLLDATPQSLPALDVIADEFVLNERALGRLRLRATNAGTAAVPIWTLDELRLEHPGARLSASGQWSGDRAGAAARTMRLDYDLEVTDASSVLTTFGIRDAVKGGAGRLEGQLAWRGSPLALDFPSLEGTLKANIGRGQFLKTEPGLAKLIGVLNLQSLPRRLSLDFRDIFAEGFAFDAISGDATIARGVARTDGLSMKGVNAQVSIRGEADLERETQQLEVQVRPELNAGLASLAYAATVNPAIGLGSMVAQMVLRQPLARIFTYEYEVRGSWNDPQVVERRRSEQWVPSDAVAPSAPGQGAGPPASTPAAPATPAAPPSAPFAPRTSPAP